MVGTLATDPFAGIVVPFVALVGDSPQRSFDVVPSSLVLQATANQLGNEGATAPASSPLVELGYERIIDGNVQSHVLMIAHWSWYYLGSIRV